MKKKVIQRPAEQPTEVPAVPPAPAGLSIKPFDDDTLKDPSKWAEWLFSHSPEILAEIFRTLLQASPADRLKTLQALFKDTISYKPLISPTAEVGTDNTSALQQLLNNTQAHFLEEDEEVDK